MATLSKTDIFQKRQPLILSASGDKVAQQQLHIFLNEGNCDVTLASNGMEVLEALRSNKGFKPDVVLLDVKLIGVDAYDVCAELHRNKETASIPVIFVTSFWEAKDKARAFSVGASDYIIKPVQKADLLSKIKKNLQEKVLERSQDVRQSSTRILAIGNETSRFKLFKNYLSEILGPELSQQNRDRIQEVTASRLYDLCKVLNIKTSEMAQHIAEFITLPYISHINPNDLVLGALSSAFCKNNNLVPVNDVAVDIAFVMSNPFDFQVQDTIRRFAEGGKSYRLMLTEPGTISELFSFRDDVPAASVIEQWPSTDAAFQNETDIELVEETKDQSKPEEVDGLVGIENTGETSPVIRVANGLLSSAIKCGASDIHIEPRENSVGIRFRIDGMLHERRPVAKSLQPALISRFKIMATMDIAERRVPQDGSLRIALKKNRIDLRVSTMPSRHGEKVVVRILDKGALSLDFDALGFEKHNLELFRKCIQKPHGMILLTGPTGSGKTTTLYTALQALNEPTTNIVTVEDPIEYDFHRITQVQVHPEAGLTFPVALRSILRQDPDVIMVGEIRDMETLDIAIKAALTGHLVLSTLHTNDAPSTVVRLVDMGSNPYLVGASVIMVAAQRLVRKLCHHCKKPITAPSAVLEKEGIPYPADAKFHQSVGCSQCYGAGYRGRVAIIEIMAVDEELAGLISRSAKVDELRRHAMTKGSLVPLARDAVLKASRGITSLEEALTVM